MDTSSYIVGFLSGLVFPWIIKSSLKTDPLLEEKMLGYFKANKDFTISSFSKDSGIGSGFLSRHKIRMAASMLVKNGTLKSEVQSNSSFFNRDETIRFSRIN
jgi:hypothetical protein